MESFGTVTRLNEQQSAALNAAWQMMSFIEGAIAPKLEVVDADTSPFLDGLYRSIQEVKKQLDIAASGDETEMETLPPVSVASDGTRPMQEAVTCLVDQGNMIKQLVKDLQGKADRMGSEVERANELFALAAILKGHSAALSDVSAIVESVKRAA